MYINKIIKHDLYIYNRYLRYLNTIPNTYIRVCIWKYSWTRELTLRTYFTSWKKFFLWLVPKLYVCNIIKCRVSLNACDNLDCSSQESASANCNDVTCTYTFISDETKSFSLTFGCLVRFLIPRYNTIRHFLYIFSSYEMTL